MRSREFTGKTTQEAIDTGLAALGVTIADVHVDVLQEGAKGLFGLFGSKPACVRLTVMEEEKEDDQGLSDLLSSFSLNEPRKKTPKAEKPAEKKAEPKAEEKKTEKAEKPAEKKAEAKPEKKAEPKAEEKKTEKTEKTEKAEKPAEKKAEAKPEKKPEKKAEKPAEKQAEEKTETKADRPKQQKKPRAPKAENAEKPDEHEYAPMVPAQPFTPTEPPVIHDEATPAGKAQRFLMDVTSLMNVKVDVYVEEREDGLYIHMIGDTLGILIGRRGETLDALQYLTSLQVNKGREGYIRVTLDTENYRAKREDSLRRLAQRMANRAQKTGRKVVLEPMNPYERRVLHTALQNHPAVTTHSEGEEPNRRVVIMLNNQPERAQQGDKAEKAERAQGDKPSSSRRRSRRRGRRGPKPEAAQNAAPQEAQDVSGQAEAPAAVDVLGE